jgi:hypothetical protein
MKTLADLRKKLSSPAERYAEYLEQQHSDGEATEFTIDDEQKANWALRKLRELEQEKKQNEEFARREKEKIDAWLEQENSKIDRLIEFFEGKLAVFADQIKQENPKFKSKRLPNGSFGYRKEPDKLIVQDEEKLIVSLELNGRDDLIKIKKLPDKRLMKKTLTVISDGRVIDPETGAIIEGVVIEEGMKKFRWKVATE